jgi:hypothetical protein
MLTGGHGGNREFAASQGGATCPPLSSLTGFPQTAIIRAWREQAMAIQPADGLTLASVGVPLLWIRSRAYSFRDGMHPPIQGLAS